MQEQLGKFFKDSDIPRRVKLPAEVVIHRTELSSADLLAVRKAGHYKPTNKDGEVCELEAGGQVLATGRIIRKGKEWYFQVKKITENGGRI